MQTQELIKVLNRQTREATIEGYGEWGYSMSLSVEALNKYMRAIDSIYNHNEAARAAVIEHFGLNHTL